MKKTLNPIISLTKNWGKSLIQVMSWELKTSLSKLEIKKNLARGIALKKNIKL